MICKDILVPNFFSKLCFKDFCSKHFPILLLWTCTKYLLKIFPNICCKILFQDFVLNLLQIFVLNLCSRQIGKLADLVTIMLWKGIWGHPFKNNHTSNLGPPSNSGLQRLPISLSISHMIPWNSPIDVTDEEHIWVWSTIQTNWKQNASSRKEYE